MNDGIIVRLILPLSVQSFVSTKPENGLAKCKKSDAVEEPLVKNKIKYQYQLPVAILRARKC